MTGEAATTPPIRMRAALAAEYNFARRVHHAGMRWIVERLFGWDDAAEDEKFQRYFVLDEVRVVELDGEPVGYLQVGVGVDALLLKDLHIAAQFQRRGIGTEILRQLLAEAGQSGKATTVGVVKFNPARNLYERLGFRITHEDTYKFYLRNDAPTISNREKPA